MLVGRTDLFRTIYIYVICHLGITVVCILKGKNFTHGLEYGTRLSCNGQTQDQGQRFFSEISLSNWEVIIIIIIIIVIVIIIDNTNNNNHFIKSQWI